MPDVWEGKMKIFGLSGKLGSGKDAFGEFLSIKGYKRIALADPLKDMARLFFFYRNVDNKARKSNEERKLLQKLGTELGRIFWERHIEEFPEKLQEMLEEGYSDPTRLWICHFEDNIKEAEKEGWKGIYVPDMRFPDEAKFIKNKRGLLCRIDRNFVSEENVEANSHISETALDTFPFHTYIINNGSLEDLKDKADNIDNNYERILNDEFPYSI